MGDDSLDKQLAKKLERVKLTPTKAEAFICPPNKSQRFLWDTEVPSLAVRATPKGSRSYIFQAWLNGAAIRITIGNVCNWSIGAARTEARRLKTLTDHGEDPREIDREKQRIKSEAALKIENGRKHTLQALCDAYVAYLKEHATDKSARDTKSAFKVHVVEAWPDLACTPAREITSRQVTEIIRKVIDAGRIRTPGILRSYLTSAYNAAVRAQFDPTVQSTFIDFEITTNPAEAVLKMPVNSGERTLNIDELKGYMSALGNDAPGIALQVHLLSGGQRVAQLLRTKIKDFDTDTNTLRLWDSKGRRKKPREHLVQLGPKATSLVKAILLKRNDAGDEESLFEIQGQSAGNRVSEISKSLSGAPFDLRDIRRTVETQLAGMGIIKPLRGQLLSHGISGVQDVHYDKHAYAKEKKAILRRWEKRLDKIAKAA